MQKLLTTFVALCVAGSSLAQVSVCQIVPTWGAHALKPDTYYVSSLGDSILLEQVRFYVSDLQLVGAHGEKTVSTAQKAYLIDAFEASTLTLPLPMAVEKGMTLCFKLGVDSLTNVSGAQSGALDPMQGMYWTWQSGYINVKIEGRSPRSPHRKHKFMFHIGGYQPPFYALRSIELPLKRVNTEGVAVAFDVSTLFAHIDMAQQANLMQPSAGAMQMADWLQQAFRMTKYEK